MRRVYTVTAGHSSTEPGNTWGGLREADLMLDLRHLVADKLRASGHLVREDGARGVNAALARAIALIPGAHLAIELHTNASANITATGVEVVALPAKRAAAQRVHRDKPRAHGWAGRAGGTLALGAPVVRPGCGRRRPAGRTPCRCRR
jgi:N-acetylmuramoyl-L-alanine amidase